MGVFLYLIDSLCHVHSRAFQFYMNDGHTIDEQHHVAPSCAGQRVLGLELRLAHYLIHALSGTYLLSIENLQIDLLAKVYLVLIVVTLDLHQSTTNELAHLVRRLQGIHLCDYLLHL